MPESGCDSAVENIVNSFVDTITRQSDNLTFVTFVSHDDDCVKPLLSKSGVNIVNTVC